MKKLIVKLLWFLRGDTNIKYLVDNGCDDYNQKAYNWYLQRRKKDQFGDELGKEIEIEKFIEIIKNRIKGYLGTGPYSYQLGDIDVSNRLNSKIFSLKKYFLTPRKILEKYGHIAKINDNEFCYYFYNSMGKFLLHKDMFGLDLHQRFDKNLIGINIYSSNTGKPKFEINEIYRVIKKNNLYWEFQDFEKFKNIDYYLMSPEPQIELIWKRK